MTVNHSSFYRLPSPGSWRSACSNRSAATADNRYQGEPWDFTPLPQDPAPVDSSDGVATVQLGDVEAQALEAMLARAASDSSTNPLTGAELSMGLNEPLGKM